MKQIGSPDLDEVACLLTMTGKLYAVFPIVSGENIEAVAFYTFDVDIVSVKIHERAEIVRKSEISQNFWASTLCKGLSAKQWEKKGYRLPANLELGPKEPVETKVAVDNSFKFRITYWVHYRTDEELRAVARHVNETYSYCRETFLRKFDVQFYEERDISILTFSLTEDWNLMARIASDFVTALTMRLGWHINIRDVESELLWFPIPVTILRCGHLKCNKCGNCQGKGSDCKSCSCYALVCMHKKCPYKECGKCIRSAIVGACDYCGDPEGHFVGYYIEAKCPQSFAIFNNFAPSVRDTTQWRNVELSNQIISKISIGANIIDKMPKKTNLYSTAGSTQGSCSSAGIGISGGILTTGGLRLVSVLVHEYFHRCQGSFDPSANIEAEAKMAQAVFRIKSGFNASISYGNENYVFMKDCESFYQNYYDLYLKGDQGAIKMYNDLLGQINNSASKYVINTQTPLQNFATLLLVE